MIDIFMNTPSGMSGAYNYARQHIERECAEKMLAAATPDETETIFHQQHNIVDEEWRIVRILEYFLNHRRRQFSPKAAKERVTIKGPAVYLDGALIVEFIGRSAGDAINRAEDYAAGLKAKIGEEK